MTGYRLTLEAENDLTAIWKYAAAENLDAADRLIERFVEKFGMLAAHPFIGEARDELVRGLRDFPAGNYVIYYRTCETPGAAVEIIRVVHGARDVGPLFSHLR